MAGIGRSISGGRIPGKARFIGLGGLIVRVKVIGLIVLVWSGCGSSFQWTGTWTGKRDLPLPEGGDPSILATLSKVELKIEPNGRFELLEGGVPKSGSFRSSGTKAYLKTTHFMDRPIEAQGEAAVKMNQEIELSAQNDGTVLFQDPGGIVKETVTLRREKG